MSDTLQAHLFFDRKCVLGYAVPVFPVGHMSLRRKNPYYALGRSVTSCKIFRGCRNSSLAGTSNGATLNTSSWLPIDPMLRSDDDAAYGGWSHGGATFENEKKKGISLFMLVGGGTSLAICLALLVHMTFSNKGFRARLYPPVAGIHQFFMPLASRVTALGSMKTFEQSFSVAEKPTSSELYDKEQKERDFEYNFSAAEKDMPRKSEFIDQRERDSETTESEVRRVPDTKLGKMFIPAVVDPTQWEALSALQKLKIVESHIQPRELCTRGEYARWLVLANSVFSRSPSYRVFPSVYIDGVTLLAFDDITPQDQDFPYIQGLAEAGVIPSKLSLNNLNSSYDDAKQSYAYTMFYPEKLLSRVDLVTWKMFADHKNLPEVDRRTLEKKSGFLDVKHICIDAWPAVFLDALAGDKSVTARAFGNSRRFQPDKPVTKGQAAIAITSGRVAAIVSEELSRLEAENSEKEAVIQELLSEMVSRGEIKSFWEKDLEEAKQQKTEADKILVSAVSELEKAKADMERSLPSLLKEKTQIEFEHEFLSSLRDEVYELQKEILKEETDINFEKEELKDLKTEAQAELEAFSAAKSLADTEKKAIILTRLWVEDEARRIQGQNEILAQAVNRWQYTELSTCSCCHDMARTGEDVPREESKY